MTITNHGRIEWGGGREKDLHRTYWIKFLLETDDDLDGPQTLTYAAGLPAVGASWTYGNDNDAYALCWPTVECETVIKREPNFWWILKYTFSTRPFRTCATNEIENPLTQPDIITGSFVGYQERTFLRRDGSPILSSSLEPIWVQKDKNMPTVSITQTVASLGLSTFSQMIDTVNDATLWGMAKRHIKLRNVPWKRLVWGSCTYYYQRTLQFDVRYDSFDEKKVRDMGHRVIDPDKLAKDPGLDRTKPENFTRASDDRGNIEKVILLDLNGEQCTDPVNHTHYLPAIELYNESNFLTLGVPATL